MYEYMQFGNRLSKLIQNERKCFQFSLFLRTNILPEDSKLNEYEVIDDSALVTVGIQTNNSKGTVSMSMPVGAFGNFGIKSNQKASYEKENKRQVRSVFQHQIQNQQEDNQFIVNPGQLSQNEYFTQKHNSKEYSEFSKSSIFESININLRSSEYPQENQHQTNQKQNLQEEQYFQLLIKNQASLDDEKKEPKTHQVMVYPSKQKRITENLKQKKEVKDMFNLSNFSSFNGINSNQQASNLLLVSNEESRFYQKEFVYLVKKIQLMQGRKLSQKGIQKIANQLFLLTPYNCPLNQHQLSDLANKMTKLNSQTVQKSGLNFHKNQSKNKSSHENSTCNPNNQKRLKIETNIQSELKSKSKSKYSLINRPRNRTIIQNASNKQNMKNYLENEKVKNKEDFKRSTSPLSYKVLMDKKKTHGQKPKNFNQIKKNTKLCAQPSDDYSTDQLSENLQSSFQCDDKAKSFEQQKTIAQQNKFVKKNSLKIILESTIEQKMKTFTFEYLSKDQNLHRQVKQYCAMNKIQTKNIKLIYQALSHHKPIITLKQ